MVALTFFTRSDPDDRVKVRKRTNCPHWPESGGRFRLIPPRASKQSQQENQREIREGFAWVLESTQITRPALNYFCCWQGQLRQRTSSLSTGVASLFFSFFICSATKHLPISTAADKTRHNALIRTITTTSRRSPTELQQKELEKWRDWSQSVLSVIIRNLITTDRQQNLQRSRWKWWS